MSSGLENMIRRAYLMAYADGFTEGQQRPDAPPADAAALAETAMEQFLRTFP